MKKSFLKNSPLLLTCLFVFFIFTLESPSISVDSPLINSTLATYQSQCTVRNTNVVWVYKTVNEKKYKRLYNIETGQWIGLDSSLTQTGSAAPYQCGRPFLIFLFIHTHIFPMCLDQFVAHCLDIIDIQLRCGMGFEHGDHTTFSPSIFHFYWILVFQLLLPLADLLLFPRLVFL